MMSGAWPPPAPSVWYVWIDRPAIAASVLSTKPASFSVSVWIATCTPVSSATAQAGVDHGRRRAPVLVQLETARSRSQLLVHRLGGHGVALAEQGDVDRPVVERLEHPFQVPRAGDGRRLRALGGPGATADDRGDPGAERLLEQLRADQVHVAVDGAGGQDPPVAGDDLRRRTDHERRVDAVHRVGVAGLADADDPPVTHTDVGLDDAPVVEHDGARDHEIGGAAWRG